MLSWLAGRWEMCDRGGGIRGKTEELLEWRGSGRRKGGEAATYRRLPRSAFRICSLVGRRHVSASVMWPSRNGGGCSSQERKRGHCLFGFGCMVLQPGRRIICVVWALLENGTTEEMTARKELKIKWNGWNPKGTWNWLQRVDFCLIVPALNK